jgi:hypothetical protein
MSDNSILHGQPDSFPVCLPLAWKGDASPSGQSGQCAGSRSQKFWEQRGRDNGMQDDSGPQHHATERCDDPHPPEQDNHPNVEDKKTEQSALGRPGGLRRQTGNAQREEAKSCKASKRSPYALRVGREQQPTRHIGHREQGSASDDF